MCAYGAGALVVNIISNVATTAAAGGGGGDGGGGGGDGGGNSSSADEVVVAAMELGIAMLEGGNRKVQTLAMTSTFLFFYLFLTANSSILVSTLTSLLYSTCCL